MNQSELGEKLAKVINTETFGDGGLMNPVQQNTFVKFVKKGSGLLNKVRVVQLKGADNEIDKLHVGEPITRPDSEGASNSVDAQTKHNKIVITQRKLRSDWNTTVEALQRNLEGNKYEQSLLEVFGARVGFDAESLAINGDTESDTSTSEGLLWSSFNGFRKLISTSGNVLDAKGEPISRNLLRRAKRAIPKQFHGMGLELFVSESVADDWSDVVAANGNGIESRAGEANMIIDNQKISQDYTPVGMKMNKLPVIKDSDLVSVNEATSGVHVANEYGPFIIATGVNDSLLVSIDAAASVAITIPSGTLEAAVVVATIQAALGTAAIVDQTPDGHIRIASATTGTSSTVQILDTSTVNAATATILGLVAATYTGAASDGTIAEGSFIIVTHPKNLIAAFQDGTRVHSSYNADRDRIETIVRYQMGVQIEHAEACLLIENVRLRDLG